MKLLVALGLSGIMRGMTDPTKPAKRPHVFAALALLIALLALCGAGCRALALPIHYTTAIDWQSYEAGLARAKAEHKPVLLLFSANWCEPCHRFAKMFEDPRVVAKAKDFVVIKVNADQREDLATKYQRGGNTLPRVYFLTPDGVLLRGAHAPRRCSRFNYDHKDPTSLLAGMDLAQKLVSDPNVSPKEDPAALTPEACAPRAGDKPCHACVKAQCCAEMIACLNDPEGCGCTMPLPRATQAMIVCSKEHCRQQCPE